jgi:hypothetical protein
MSSGQISRRLLPVRVRGPDAHSAWFNSLESPRAFKSSVPGRDGSGHRNDGPCALS